MPQRTAVRGPTLSHNFSKRSEQVSNAELLSEYLQQSDNQAITKAHAEKAQGMAGRKRGVGGRLTSMRVTKA